MLIERNRLETWSQSIEESHQPSSHLNHPCASPIINPRFPPFTNLYIELKNSALAHRNAHHEVGVFVLATIDEQIKSLEEEI